LLGFFESRGAVRKLRASIGVGNLWLAAVLAAVLWDPAGSHRPLAWIMAVLIICFGFIRMLLWLLGPWPSARQSVWSTVVADLAITVVCWLKNDHLVGLAITPVFLLPGALLTFLHGSRLIAAHIGWVALTIGSLAVAVGADNAHGGPVVAAALGALNLTVAVGLLPILRVGFGVVRQGADESLIDPLTGLANRRGLDHRLNQHPADSGAGVTTVFAIDLDRFKSVNDRYGHSAGDDVLVQTAAHIQAALGPGAVAARVGGEEFVAVGLLEPSSVQRIAEQLRRAIAEDTEPQVTASIGVALTTAHQLPDGQGVALALQCADTAMYAVKRDGGNAVRVRPCTDYADMIKPEAEPSP
jgi:diguanylate cyclase (GGDEF)-like protein